MSDNVHKGHRERVRERYIKSGLDSFEDHQILEFLLFYCYPMKDTNEIAHRMIKEFGTLTNLFESDALEISKRCKVSKNVAVLVSMIPPLSRIYSSSRWKERTRLESSRSVGQYAISLFIGKTVECFYLICLDSQCKLIYSSLISEGTVNESSAYPREVVKTALKFQAARVVLTHNHPSGLLVPSQEDIYITEKIVNALDAVDIEVVDHIIVGSGKYLSFSEKKIFPF